MSVILDTVKDKVIEYLIADNVLTSDDLAKFKKVAEKENEPLMAYLQDNGHVSDETLTKYLAQASDLPYVNLGEATIDNKILQLIPVETAERFMSVALGEQNNRLVVAMLDANNVQAVDFLSNKVKRNLKVYMASQSGINRVLAQYKTDLRSGLSDAIGSSDDDDDDEVADGKTVLDIGDVVQDSPISRALNTILEYAVKAKASDIHIEPLKHEIKIRTRVDGILREVMRLPKDLESALVSRIKILSNLKIDEHRIPQDGQFAVLVSKRSIDLRISISPVVWGEQVVIRILDKSGTSMDLAQMGYAGRALRAIHKGLKNSNGMILTSGPTGSGKSTSMYAMIKEIISDEINIVTLEDPVEYKIEGVNQIQVNTNVGLSFAGGLRSILRQDPDVVMVGEIRDEETARLAVQAALTGHLVFSTLHTNSAAGVLPRLLDMGIEPYLIASTVKTVIGQRLVRRIGKNVEYYESAPAITEAINHTVGHILPTRHEDIDSFAADLGHKTLPLSGQKAYTLTKGIDSAQEPGGYKGRLGLYEVIDISEEIESLILKRASSTEIQKKAEELGTVSMVQDGYLKTLNGLTTLDEVNRVAAGNSV